MSMDTLGVANAAGAALVRRPRLPLDLFSSDVEGRGETPAPPVMEDTAAVVDIPPEPGELYAALWRDYWQACEHFDATLQACAATLPTTGALVRRFSGPDTARQAEQARIDVAADITRDLAQIAAERFSGEGCAPLKIDVEELLADVVHGPARQRRRTGALEVGFFDAAAVWARLCREFGGTVGLERGYRESAMQIRTSFGLHPGTNVECRRSGVVLSLPVWVDSISKRSERKKLTFQSTERLLETLPALRTFAAWADDDGTLGEGLHGLAEHFGWGGKRDLSSREKIALGGSVCVVTYQTRFEFVMAPALAEKLQLFLGLFGDAPENEQ
jgi:hypothetical protein